MNLNLQNEDEHPIVAGHIGSVVDVIAGHLPQPLSQRLFNAERFQYGFELASPESAASLGEAVIVNGYCYTNSTDKASQKYNKTISGKQFMTSGVFVIPKGVRATHTIEQTFSQDYSLNCIYGALYEQIKKPFAFAAFFEFTSLCATAICKPPIYDENIFEHSKAYYSTELITLNNVNAFLVGAVADYHDIGADKQPVLKELEVVLYKNPFDNHPGLTTHAHGITFTYPVGGIGEILPDRVDKTLHVFAGESVFKSVKGEIFSLQAIKDLSK